MAYVRAQIVVTTGRKKQRVVLNAIVSTSYLTSAIGGFAEQSAAVQYPNESWVRWGDHRDLTDPLLRRVRDGKL